MLNSLLLFTPGNDFIKFSTPAFAPGILRIASGLIVIMPSICILFFRDITTSPICSISIFITGFISKSEFGLKAGTET